MSYHHLTALIKAAKPNKYTAPNASQISSRMRGEFSYFSSMVFTSEIKEKAPWDTGRG
jgi:hypothetical protein